MKYPTEWLMIDAADYLELAKIVGSDTPLKVAATLLRQQQRSDPAFAEQLQAIKDKEAGDDCE